MRAVELNKLMVKTEVDSQDIYTLMKKLQYEFAQEEYDIDVVEDLINNINNCMKDMKMCVMKISKEI